MSPKPVSPSSSNLDSAKANMKGLLLDAIKSFSSPSPTPVI